MSTDSRLLLKFLVVFLLSPLTSLGYCTKLVRRL